MRKYKVRWHIAILVIIIFIAICLFRSWEQTKGDEVIEVFLNTTREGEEWIGKEEILNDLEYLKETLENVHPATRKGLSQQTLDKIKEYRGLSQIRIDDFTNIINEILTTVGDSHTSVITGKGAQVLPVEGVIIDNKLYVVKSRDLCVGDQITKVGGVSIEQLWEKMKHYRPAENTRWLEVQFEDNWSDRRFLEYSGVNTVLGKVEIEAIRKGEVVKRMAHFTSYAYKYRPTRVNQGKEVVSYEIDEEKELCILALTRCEYNEAYIEKLSKVFKEIKEKEIKYLAVDVRGNGGGNSQVINELLRYLPIKTYKQGGGIRRLSREAKEQRGYMSIYGSLGSKHPQKILNKPYEEYTYTGKIYVLVDKHTFSSAMMVAMTLQDNNLAEVIGTPTGGKPHSYGDILQFQLPHSQIKYSISYTEWFRIDEDKNEEDWISPTFEINYTLEDIIRKRDKTREKLYEVIK